MVVVEEEAVARGGREREGGRARAGRRGPAGLREEEEGGSVRGDRFPACDSEETHAGAPTLEPGVQAWPGIGGRRHPVQEPRPPPLRVRATPGGPLSVLKPKCAP